MHVSEEVGREIRLFAGRRLPAGMDHDNAGNNRDHRKEEASTFSGHSDAASYTIWMRFAVLFSEDENR